MTDTPAKWSWGCGETSNSYYDHWLYCDRTFTEKNGDNWSYEIHLYWDKGGKHNVHTTIVFLADDGDIIDYETIDRKQFDSKESAENFAISEAKNLY